MKTPRFPALMLCLAILLSLAACGQARPEAPDTAEPVEQTSEPIAEPAAEEVLALDAELQRAYDAGLLPEAWLEDIGALVSVAEFNELLSVIVRTCDEALLPQWENIASEALHDDRAAHRDDAILSIFEAAMLMGIDGNRGMNTNDDWEGMSPAPDWWEGMRHKDYSFSNWDEPYENGRGEYEVISNAAWYVQDHISLVSGKNIFEPTAQWTFAFDRVLTRDEAVRAALRFEECDCVITYGERDYVALADAGTYDKSIVTDALLNAPSELPEVTQAKLPSEWKGTGLSARKQMAGEYLHYSESDIRFLAENGFNIARLFLSFETLRYPDYPENVRIVNQCELRELDQLLAWCLKYDVHLQIAMLSYLRADGTANIQEDSVMPKNDEEWALTRDYWMMLATRYAGISSKYLTFDLCNEAEPRGGEQDIANAKQGLATVVAAIREADPERVLLYSQAGQGNVKWTEAFASLGVAVACHVYAPNVVTLSGWDYYNEENPYAVPCWPLPWFPVGNVMISKADIVLTGAIEDADLSVHAENSGAHPCVVVYADGQEVDRLYLQGELRGDNEYYYGERQYTTHIPAGTKEVRLRVGDDWASLDTITIERSGVKTVLLASDTAAVPDYVDPLPMIVNGDGSYTNSENRVYDEDLIYEVAVKPYRDVAEKYGVGFVCNEFAMCGVRVYWDIGLVTAVHETYLNMMKKYDLGWCYSEEFNIFPKHLRILYGDESQWTGATVEEVTYTYDDGRTETVKYCKELVDQLRAHTIK